MAFSYNKYRKGDELLDAEEKKKRYEADYADSDRTSALYSDYEAAKTDKPAAWDGGSFGDQMRGALDKIMNREKFEYDLNGDALYQQYKDKYIQQGQMAMADTMGRAAALTGGYGNSYANMVGQQAYQGYLQDLNDRVPELYKLALDRYNREGDDLMDQYGLLSDQYAREYGERQDRLNEYNTEVNRAYDVYNNERANDQNLYNNNRTYYANNYNNEYNRDYGQYGDEYARAMQMYQQGVSEEQDARDYALRQAQADLGNEQWEREMALKESQFAETQRANLADEAAAMAKASASSSKSSGSGGDPLDKWVKVYDESDKNNKNTVTYQDRDGHKITVKKGENPYTGTTNADVKFGTFGNGYQPDNIDGQKLVDSGYKTELNGWEVTVWQTTYQDRRGDRVTSYWAWDGLKNRYVELEEE